MVATSVGKRKVEKLARSRGRTGASVPWRAGMPVPEGKAMRTIARSGREAEAAGSNPPRPPPPSRHERQRRGSGRPRPPRKVVWADCTGTETGGRRIPRLYKAGTERSRTRRRQMPANGRPPQGGPPSPARKTAGTRGERVTPALISTRRSTDAASRNGSDRNRPHSARSQSEERRTSSRVSPGKGSVKGERRAE